MVEKGASPERASPSFGDGLFGLDCHDAVHQLYHYLDGELTEERRQAIALHLDRCGPCAGAAHFEAELRRVVASHCRDRVPESLRQRIAEALEAARTTGRPTGGRTPGGPTIGG